MTYRGLSLLMKFLDIVLQFLLHAFFDSFLGFVGRTLAKVLSSAGIG
jgi:hypothetical protein